MATTTTAPPAPESQKQRWLKYGANVLLSIVIVVVLAGVLIALAQRRTLRVDLTRGSALSLKPQTVTILNDLDQQVQIVGLYARPRSDQADRQAQDYYQAVSDLLDEYRRKSSNVLVEMIDPVAEPTKLDQLITKITQSYGPNVEAYRQLASEQFPQTVKQIKELAESEVALQEKLPLEQIQDEQVQQTLLLAMATVQGFPPLLQRTQEAIDLELSQKLPRYRDAVQAARSDLDSLSRMAGKVATDLATLQDNQQVSEEIRQYASAAIPRFGSAQKLADDLIANVDALGELKLDELSQKLRNGSIVVVGRGDIRVLNFEDVWRLPDSSRMWESGERPKLNFAGEQQISTALVALGEAQKPKVVFVRPAGPPLVGSGSPFEAELPFSEVAARLRQYNFEVMEKDLSGQWAMQAQMRGMPVTPEPTDEQMKDAVWVVLSFQPGVSAMGGPNPLGPKLAEHLGAGGSAMVLFTPRADNLSSALSDWGIEVLTDTVAVHAQIHSSGPDADGGDIVDEALRKLPIVFVMRQYGQHDLARPIESLEALMVPMLIVKTSAVANHTVTPLLPVPDAPPSWGTRDIDRYMPGAEGNFADVTGPGPDDLRQPLYSGAASQRNDGGRVVAIGGLEFAMDQLVTMPDRDLARRGVFVARFPGNAELFQNAIFWLAKKDTLLAISPNAMEVSRIRPMSAATLRFWHWGVLIVGLPLIVIAAGVVTYLRRRD
jgi:hypothetical protein